jgi:hypothetical protein
MAGDFYRVDETQLYLRPQDFRIMTDDQLAQIIESGLVEWEAYKKSLRKKAFQKRFNIFATVMIAVGGAALLAGGPAAAGPAVEAAGGGAAGGAGAGGLFGQLQTVAGYIGKGAAIVGKVTGNDSVNQLAAAANLIGSPSMTDAIESGVNFQLQREGAAIAKDDANGQAALRELIAREQADYAANLRGMAEQQAAATGTQVTVQPPKPLTLQDVLPYVLPVALSLLMNG